MRLVPADYYRRNEATAAMAASILVWMAVAPGIDEIADHCRGASVEDRRRWAKPACGTRPRVGWHRLRRSRARPAAGRGRTPRPEPAGGAALGRVDRAPFALPAVGCCPVA